MSAKRAALSIVAAVLSISLTTCDSGDLTTPEKEESRPIEGIVEGVVSIEGAGLGGVEVQLSGRSTTTDEAGGYRFPQVEYGSHTVSLSDYPAEAEFESTSKIVVVTQRGQVVRADFRGSKKRNSTILGTVTADGAGVAGVTVSLSGPESRAMSSSEEGGYSFEDLSSGHYTVQISGFDPTQYSFPITEQSLSVGVGGRRDGVPAAAEDGRGRHVEHGGDAGCGRDEPWGHGPQPVHHLLLPGAGL
jgi:hypothetical protein